MDPTKGSLPMAGPPMPNVAALTGPILIGALLDYFFFGVLSLQLCAQHILSSLHNTNISSSHQTYTTTHSPMKDSVSNSSVPFSPSHLASLSLTIQKVYFVYSLELIQICCTAADIYFWFGTGFGNVVRLNVTYLSPFDTPMIGAIVALIVQLFFCYRIWKLSRSQWHLYTAVFIGAISFLQAAGGIGGGISGHVNKYFSVATETNRIYAYIWLLGEAVADVLIAVTMTHLADADENLLQLVWQLSHSSYSLSDREQMTLQHQQSSLANSTFNYRIVLRRKDPYDNSSAGYSLSGDSGTRFTSFLATTTELGA
ncbi:hypothetical protein AMATHDRAFT_50860 [Amanita thiersii Skay4041]|uniref:Uncharacterized protein n=1 Tax=Amanita thiersii Skay4041 TaxID=703135 RepID=A0A2A9NG68_9AGAR|nr:hypothetical protein AMATHDRAFT_50860 [Amanita thiersii Skay4041]